VLIVLLSSLALEGVVLKAAAVFEVVGLVEAIVVAGQVVVEPALVV